MKITEPLRSARLRRPLVPSLTKDSDIPGLALHVTTRRAFWALSYQPKGVNPSTGKRWGGGVRHELGDAMLMTVKEARTDALKAKLVVKAGREARITKDWPPRPPLWLSEPSSRKPSTTPSTPTPRRS